MTPEIRAQLVRDGDVDHQEIIKLCNAALKGAKKSPEVTQCKIIALLKLDRFDEAVKLYEASGSDLKQTAQLEYAYALYKSGQLEMARDATRNVETPAARHLEAQASYRLEDFETSQRLYRNLLQSAGDEENDIRINGRATDAQLEWQRQGSLVQRKKADAEDLEAFESTYNVACACIARGELAQASFLLQKARDLCLVSDLTEDEKQAELISIRIQQLHVLSVLHKTQDAEATASEIEVAKLSDPSLTLIANINKLAVHNPPLNPFLAHKIFHESPSIPTSDQPFTFQKTLMEQNELTLDLMSFKFKGLKKSTVRRAGENSSPSTSPIINNLSIARAAAYAQNQLGKLGLQSILPLLETNPKDVGLLATVVQLYILTKNHGAAIRVMETFLKRLEESQASTDLDVRYAPGLVAMAVSLFMTEGRKSHIRTELAKAASYWRHRSKSPPALLRSAGLALLETGESEEKEQAREVFETLRKVNPNDRFAAAGLLAARGENDDEDTRQEASKLTSVEKLTAGVDAVALERAGIPQTASTVPGIVRKRAAEEDKKPAKKRVRKSRLPKEFDPSKKPDPERWLPLRDRSYYRPKGRKGKQKQAAQTQGLSEKSDSAKNAATEQPKPHTAGGGGGGGQKKKKKGKR